MDPSKIRRLPALQEYLQLQPHESAVTVPAGNRTVRGSWGVGFLAFALAGGLTIGFGLGPCLVAAITAGITAGMASERMRTAKAQRVSRFEGIGNLKARLEGICSRKRVHREMDVGAAIALESCARSYLQIRRTLTSPAWTADIIGDNWGQMRAEALHRAEDAMDEAIFLCRSWIGESRQARRTNWKAALGELLDGDFDDAIEAFTDRDDDDEEKRGLEFQPPLSKASGFALEPVRKIGQNLKRLAQELEEAQQVFASPATNEPSKSDLEKTLQNLRELKQAESELNEAVQLRLKG